MHALPRRTPTLPARSCQAGSSSALPPRSSPPAPFKNKQLRPPSPFPSACPFKNKQLRPPSPFPSACPFQKATQPSVPAALRPPSQTQASSVLPFRSLAREQYKRAPARTTSIITSATSSVDFPDPKAPCTRHTGAAAATACGPAAPTHDAAC
eukprot:365602-Chlamydomonas_euryale.AAC.18